MARDIGFVLADSSGVLDLVDSSGFLEHCEGAGKDRTYLPSTLSLEEAKKFMPPTGQLAHVPDTAAGRLRCYYGKGTERISQGASLEGRTLRQAAIPLFKWAWGLHKGATGKLCPYVFD